MNLLERIPTRWLLTGAAAACLVLWAAPGWAQTSPVNGRELFNNTNAASGLNNFTNDCINCHLPGVQNRRTAIGGGPYADISFDTAMTRLGNAVSQNRGGMNQFTRLGEGLQDIAAYIADTPKTSVSSLSFRPTAINSNTLSQNIDLTNGTTMARVVIVSVAVTGTSASRFTITSDSCSAQVLDASTSCRVSVRFSAPDTATYTAPLRLTLRVQGDTATFTRDVTLDGQVAGGTTTPPPAAGGDSGGGALGLAWLAGLALATGVLARRRRG